MMYMIVMLIVSVTSRHYSNLRVRDRRQPGVIYRKSLIANIKKNVHNTGADNSVVGVQIVSSLQSFILSLQMYP